jgi:hypothetical protein
VEISTTSAGYPRQRLLCLRQPEGHLHVAIQVDGGSQGGTRLLPLANPGVQYAKAALAVRLERAHAQFLGQGESLRIVRGGRLPLDGKFLGRKVAEQP